MVRMTGLLFCKGCTILVAAFLRLGIKYEIPHLRSEAVKRLIHEYPLTLEKWIDCDMRNDIMLERGAHFSVANLAREVGLTSILPAALYFVCEVYSFVEILEGIRRDDGQHVILSADNQKACLRGRERLIEAQHSQTFKWMDATDVTLSPGCSNIEKCKQWRNRCHCFSRLSGLNRCVILWSVGLPTMRMVFAAPASVLPRQCLKLVGPTFGTSFLRCLACSHGKSW
ncbi:hypothetical protein PILCRDRAFT_429401 [Piloderma croceum F 1598]|uniref:Uncharacterized protein n=1 Tax=Piloderma croceum (strain F 1598) TaxID=765440 RepID=A0A0C3C1U1_PILCF|nr:hypothetical protein PILCRDRAFT_429401 [Piloderma croceum F 1598]